MKAHDGRDDVEVLESLGIEPPTEESLLDHMLDDYEATVLLDIRPLEGRDLSDKQEGLAFEAYFSAAEDAISRIRARFGLSTPGHEYEPYRVLLDHDERTGAALVMHPNDRVTPFVVCQGYDAETGSWSSGSYAATLAEAQAEYDAGCGRGRDVGRTLFDEEDLEYAGIDAGRLGRKQLEELLDKVNGYLWDVVTDGNAQYGAVRAARSGGADPARETYFSASMGSQGPTSFTRCCAGRRGCCTRTWRWAGPSTRCPDFDCSEGASGTSAHMAILSDPRDARRLSVGVWKSLAKAGSTSLCHLTLDKTGQPVCP